MVIGLLSIASIPTVTGVALGVSEQRKEESRKEDERRLTKFYIEAGCKGDDEAAAAKELQGRRVTLRDNKVYFEYPQTQTGTKPTGHPAQAFFIGYPDPDGRDRGDGLVSSIAPDPPVLNWIYIDKHTLELKYGNRSQSVDHIVGPWDWTEDEHRVTIEGHKKGDCFAAVEEEDGVWAVYYDRNQSGLVDLLAGEDKRVVRGITLERRVIIEENDHGS